MAPCQRAYGFWPQGLPHHLMTFSGQSPDLSALQDVPFQASPIELRAACLELTPHRLFAHAIRYPSTTQSLDAWQPGYQPSFRDHGFLRPVTLSPSHRGPPPLYNPPLALHQRPRAGADSDLYRRAIAEAMVAAPEEARPFPVSPRVIFTIPYNRKSR